MSIGWASLIGKARLHAEQRNYLDRTQLTRHDFLLHSARMHDDEEHRVREIVDGALVQLMERDVALLRLNVHERTITARLAEYMQVSLPEWNVDPEYNRIRDRVKQVELDGRAVNVVPDIIAHRRNSGDNLFILEAKKVGDDQADEYDRKKTKALKEQQGYRYAVFLRLRTGAENPGVESVEWL